MQINIDEGRVIMEEDSMKKLLIGTALLFAALPFTFDGVTPAVSKAQAVYRGIHHRHAYGGNGMGGATNVPASSVPQPLYTEAQMAAARYGCYPAPFDYSTRVCMPRYR
jgi:hypothetical protein